MLNVDTNVLLFAMTGVLKPSETALLNENRWSISAIVLWEIGKLAQKGRISVDLEDPEVVRTLAQIHVWPITREIAHMSTKLDFKSDPADELIAATSIVHNVPLLTRDRALFKSRIVPLAR